MNNLIQLIVILLGLLLIQQLISKNPIKSSISFLQKNEQVEDKTTKLIDLLPVPAIILASQNPNVIETNKIKTL